MLYELPELRLVGAARSIVLGPFQESKPGPRHLYQEDEPGSYEVGEESEW